MDTTKNMLQTFCVQISSGCPVAWMFPSFIGTTWSAKVTDGIDVMDIAAKNRRSLSGRGPGQSPWFSSWYRKSRLLVGSSRNMTTGSWARARAIKPAAARRRSAGLQLGAVIAERHFLKNGPYNLIISVFHHPFTHICLGTRPDSTISKTFRPLSSTSVLRGT